VADGQFLTFPQAFNLAAEHYKAGRANEASELCEKIVAGAPNYADAVHLKAVLLMDKGELASAESMARRATELSPQSASFVNTVGVILKKQRRFDEAMTFFQRAVELEPGFIPVHTNIGLILQMNGDYEAAEAAHRRSVELDPGYVTALHNLANLLMDAGKLDESLEFFRRAIEKRPGDPEIHTHRALAFLMKGEFERGWDEYEWRMQMRSQLAKHSLKSPLWDGRGYEGQTLLVYHEQGFGDVIQCARYIKQAKARGGTLVVACAPPIGRLIEQVEGVDKVVTADVDIPPHHFKFPMMALPRLFGARPGNIPNAMPYLKPAPGIMLMGGEGTKRVGIAWAGSPTHDNDHRRSMSATELAPILDVPGITFYSLQFGSRAAELEAAGLKGRLIELGDETLGDFYQTAGYVDQLDLVITIDTVTGHLAAALNKPTWLLLSFSSDFRWLREGSDTEWYPSMRLYRQSKPMQWREPVASVVADLAAFAGGNGAGPNGTARRGGKKR
jgi:Flp pilus assembly protein TadD